MPGMFVSIGWNGPRNSAGASGFRSHVSMVLRPPFRNRMISDTSRFADFVSSSARACRASKSASDNPDPNSPATPTRRRSRRARPSQKPVGLFIISPWSLCSMIEHKLGRIQHAPGDVFGGLSAIVVVGRQIRDRRPAFGFRRKAAVKGEVQFFGQRATSSEIAAGRSGDPPAGVRQLCRATR